jgi:hypothetical protein
VRQLLFQEKQLWINKDEGAQMKGLLQDVRYGLRAFLRAPGFTALAVVTLALGIGANTTIFSWINSTLLNPIPGARDASQLVLIDNGTSVTSVLPLSYPDYVDLRDRAKSFSGMIASDIDQMGLTGIGKPEHIWGSLVSANYFDVLGVQPVLGRGFLPADEQKIGGAPVVVISYRLWQTHYGGDKATSASPSTSICIATRWWELLLLSFRETKPDCAPSSGFLCRCGNRFSRVAMSFTTGIPKP